MKRTIKEYVEPKAFEDKALFDDFKDSIGGRCFNKDSVYRWVYKLTDIKPTDDEIYDIMDKWVKNKWAYEKENERTGANFYYFDLKETVSESKKILIESSGFQKGITNEMDKFLNYIKKNRPENEDDVREIILTYLDNGNINNNNFVKTIRDIVLYLSRDMRAGIFKDIHDIMYKTIKSDIIPEIEGDKEFLNSFSEAEQKILKYFLDHKDIDKKDIDKRLDATIWNDFNWKEKLSNIWKYFVLNEEFDKFLHDEIVPYAVEDYVDRYMKKTVTEGRKNMKRIVKEEKEIKLIGKFYLTKPPKFTEIGYFGKGTWNDAMEFSRNNSEGWRLPNNSDTEPMRMFRDEIEDMVGGYVLTYWTSKEYRKDDVLVGNLSVDGHGVRSKNGSEFILLIR